jgi:hypothetical protein
MLGCGADVKCQGWESACEREDAERQRQNTRYVDDDALKNFIENYEDDVL